MDAARTLSHLSVSDELKIPIARVKVIPPLISLIDLQEEEIIMHVARLLAELSDAKENENILLEAKALETLISLIDPSVSFFRLARLEAVRALSSLSSSENKEHSCRLKGSCLPYLHE